MSSEMNQRYTKSQIEITDLIAEAVVHASARRKQVLDAQESLSELSDEEEKGINGGSLIRIIIGLIFVD
ncbi:MULTISPECIES: hypothetical protein [unclassified Nostoc]|uniref:hypothetical protein n=1 Tax=unclassified Nostoc TaxID=2593658 RepID=UPI000CF3510D|nr:hypothetical protein [Nostoc sp. 'Peltigera membranacea cyanobiont' N6]AVH63808.1 hypothetical protein NPM_2052 [Nostoc sp. 'Peltigera membranacea cyanobiont' N6]